MNEIGKITVADSITVLTDEYRKEQESIIKQIEVAKKGNERLLSMEKKQAEIDKYKAAIAKNDATIDSLRNAKPDNLKGYDNKNPNDVLAVIVRCKYSVNPPGTKAVEETFDFYLSPDGSKCFAKKRVD